MPTVGILEERVAGDGCLGRQPRRELGPRPDVALDCASATVQFHQSLDQRQPDPCSLVSPSEPTIALDERTEESLEYFWGDAWTGVRDRQFEVLAGLALHRGGDFATRDGLTARRFRYR